MKSRLAEINRMVHTKCRQKYYAGSNIKRQTVPDQFVPWTIEFKDYNPPEYEHPKLTEGHVWSDPKIDNINFKPAFNHLDGPVNRKSHNGEYQVIDGRPRNPMGRTGLVGRGLLGRWGPNHAADPIVTRWKRDTNNQIKENSATGLKILQMVTIQRRDNGEWAIPGGMVDPGEVVSATVKREFMEEALSMSAISQEVDEFFNSGDEIYKGYVDDPRNTDNAWMETVAYHFHACNENVANINLNAGDDAASVRWMDLSKELKLYASHSDMIKLVVSKLNAHW